METSKNRGLLLVLKQKNIATCEIRSKHV